jgi:hypothetical protein
MPSTAAASSSVSPWVRNRTEAGDDYFVSIELGSAHDGGLLKRGVHSEIETD